MDANINQSSMLSIKCMLRNIYRIERYLSSGGFGNTYVATNTLFEETVAIKEFFIRGVTQRESNNTTVSVSNGENKDLFDEQLLKFIKEARRLRKLKNKHIVYVHDIFKENGTAYYVMDYIDGENLSEKLKRQGAPLDEEEVIGHYLPQLLDALDCVHQQGLWHLDLKPANIMVDRDGNICLIDFGASKQRSASGGATASTSVSYTNGYAPLEQMEQRMDKFGPWTDIYALGATLYNLLSYKRPPMPSDIDDDMTADKHLALPLPENVSEKTKQLILKMLNTNRFKRPQSVKEVMDVIGIPSMVSQDKIKPNAEETKPCQNNKPEESDKVIQVVDRHEDTVVDQQGENHKTNKENVSPTKEEISKANGDDRDNFDDIKEKSSLWKKLFFPIAIIAVVAVVISVVLYQRERKRYLDEEETAYQEQLLLSTVPVLTIQIDSQEDVNGNPTSKGKVLLKINRWDILGDMINSCLGLYNENDNNFNDFVKSIDNFGAPFDELLSYFNQPAYQRQEMPMTGIPLDSIDGCMSEFQLWVSAARVINEEILLKMKVADSVKDDTEKRVMNQLDDMDELNADGTLKDSEDLKALKASRISLPR